MKKQYFAILDTETTENDTVADIGIVICDRKGTIFAQCAVLVKNHYDTMSLFYDRKATGLWSVEYAKEKRIKYDAMLIAGSRMLASVSAINIWIAKAIGQYNPVLTAYNLAFDLSKCRNTEIDLTGFSDSFCLWSAAVGNICKTKAYRQFALDNHLFNNVTQYGNLTFKTSAESVTGYLAGNMTEEPHTALEDAMYYELPILKYILAKRKWKEKIEPYNWRDFQAKDHFIAR